MRFMKVQAYQPGDIVTTIPDTEWVGRVVKKHPHRNNGYQVETISSPNPFDPPGHRFYLRPVSMKLVRRAYAQE